MDLMLPMNTTLAQSFTLAYTWNPVLTNVLVGVFLLISGAMILLVLIQRPQGGGLSGAFGAGGGGGGAGQTAFGTKTGDVLTMATISIFVLFLITAIVLNFATRPGTPAPAGTNMTTPQKVDQEYKEEGQQGANEENNGTNTINNPEQAVDDTMSSTPSVESSEPAGDTPPSDTPASSGTPASDTPAPGDG